MKKPIDTIHEYQFLFDIIITMDIVITTLFGLETLTRIDLESCGYIRDQIQVSDGQVVLTVPDDGFADDIARVNMFCGCAERVFFSVGDFRAEDFDMFFDETAALPWAEFIPEDRAFVITGYSRKSKLFGVPAMQSLAKKAVCRSLARAKGLPEDSPVTEDSSLGTVKIQFAMVSDNCRMLIDTTGAGLHKRGYRPLTHEAPIRETLALAMVRLAGFRPFSEEAMYDPFCGSGTIVIEAARYALGIAPGRDRMFGYTDLPYIGRKPLIRAREEACDKEDLSPLDDIFFSGSDIDRKAVASAKANAESAGVADFVRFDIKDALRMDPARLTEDTGFARNIVITNPPYGGRLMTPEEAAEIYKEVARLYLTPRGMCRRGIRLSVITPDNDFEKATGFKADKRYKLYNGNKVCHLNNYYKLDKENG